MPRPVRLVLIALVALLALPAAAVRAATHMPVGFYDDASFRWSSARTTNIEDAAATGASVIHTTANWHQVAPKRPARASNGTTRRTAWPTSMNWSRTPHRTACA